MPAHLRHISINADDVERARRFYEAVFGWGFAPWGPPDFYLLQNAGVGGGLQGAREIVPGVRIFGVEATFGVEDVEVTRAAVAAAGGRVVFGPVHIQTVGTLIYFEDTEGNLVGAMRYDAPHAATEPPPNAGMVARFNLNADDIDRAMGFYGQVFGWTFDDFRHHAFTKNLGADLPGAIFKRREIKPGAVMRGIEIIVGVPSVAATLTAVEALGGKIVHREAGATWIEDTEGNVMAIGHRGPVGPIP